MLTFLLVAQAIVGVFLVGVILMQQSEGGGLGMGGSPTGLMSARGAADFLTRATTVLAAVFIGLSILHAVLATSRSSGGDIDTSLARQPVAEAPAVPVPSAEAPVPLAGGPVAVPASPAEPLPVPARPATTRAERETRAERVPGARAERARVERAPATTAAPVVAPSVPAPTPAPANAN